LKPASTAGAPASVAELSVKNDVPVLVAQTVPSPLPQTAKRLCFVPVTIRRHSDPSNRAAKPEEPTTQTSVRERAQTPLRATASVP
jgi:hypothetical protein